MNYNNLKEYAPVFVRIGIGLVFLWFGLNQVFNSVSWIGLLPDFASNIPLAKETLIQIHGSFEIFMSLLLITGFFVRVPALLLSLQLMIITLNLGYNAIAVRDFGLTFATFSVFLHGRDSLCLKNYLKLNNLFWDS